MKNLIAETAYNIIQALPENELQRLYKMLDRDRKAPLVSKQKKKVDPVWTLEQYVDVMIKHFNDKKLKRITKRL